ncbi:Rieske (2Fe-2S) protein [Photobacterium arenosum]|uniref:Rieske (2Fe-2S) protein n=1 Tax=Photobacterium arenosum TaxID=2774143 RepID=UPI00288AF2EE|nr:Rieske 2Fe-2S domain-containing protein [Photobacterium arenosum]
MANLCEIPQALIPAENERRFITFNGKDIALFNVAGQYHAINDSCPHQGASLCSGRLSGHILQCCAHGLRFDLSTGYMLHSQQVKLECFAVQTRGERVFIELTEEIPE